MKQKPEYLQLGLFDAVEPAVVLAPEQTAELVTLLAALLAEIAAALAKGEIGDDKNHD